MAQLLARLQRPQQHGSGFRADCPLGHSSRGALSLSESDDGRVMLHCFAGCSASDVVGALGLTLADLFPRLERRNLPPTERARLRDLAGIAEWRAALGVLSREAMVIEAAATMVTHHEPLAASDIDRVRLASHRVHSAREVLT
jgi:hypothetical protein